MDSFTGKGIDDHILNWPESIFRKACCAKAILDHLDSFNQQLKSAGMPAIDLTIGINTGQVAVGHMGSLTRKNYTVIGDVVNIAARLQQRCGELRQHILIGEPTANACKTHKPERLGEIDLKGKKLPVTVFTI